VAAETLIALNMTSMPEVGIYRLSQMRVRGKRSLAEEIPCCASLLQTLGQSNILSAPVLDEDGEYFGCLSVNDLLKSLYKGEGQLQQSREGCATGGAARALEACQAEKVKHHDLDHALHCLQAASKQRV